MHEFMPEFMKLLFDAVYCKNRGTTLSSILCCVTYDLYNFTYMTWHPEGNVNDSVSRWVSQWVRGNVTYKDATHLKPKFNIFNSIHRYYLWQVKQSYGSISINRPPPIWQSLIYLHPWFFTSHLSHGLASKWHQNCLSSPSGVSLLIEQRAAVIWLIKEMLRARASVSPIPRCYEIRH